MWKTPRTRNCVLRYLSLRVGAQRTAGMLATWILAGVTWGQLIHQEGFETDGDGSRYTIVDRGFEITAQAGPGVWGHSFDATQIGFIDAAPARRAAILWDHRTLPDDFTPHAYEVWSSLVDWAMAGKQSARIGFFPGYELSDGMMIVAEMLEAAGHTVEEVLDAQDLPDPSEIDLLIHTSEDFPVPEIAFAGYPVPLIAFRADNHDDTGISGMGLELDFAGPVELQVVSENQDHPALGGKTGTIPWTEAATILQGIGKSHSGGRQLATVEDPATGDPISALWVVEEGDSLLGGFNPDPDGESFFVGAALSRFGSAAERQLELNVVDVSDKTDVQLTVALAATDADFEPDDYLRILIDPNNSGEFQLLAEYIGNADKAMEDPASGHLLTPNAFQDVTFDIPAGATQLVVRFDAINTWGNEIVAIDNVRIFSGTLLPGDYDGNGQLDASDLDLQASAISAGDNPVGFDLNGDDQVDIQDRFVWVHDLKKTWIGDANLDMEFNSGDMVQAFARGKYETGQTAGWADGDFNGDTKFGSSDMVAAFVAGGYEQGERPAAASSVPEPYAVTLAFIGLLGLTHRARPRRR